MPIAGIENAREGEGFGEFVSSALEMLSLSIYGHIQVACPISYGTHVSRAHGSLGILINCPHLMYLETLVYCPFWTNAALGAVSGPGFQVRPDIEKTNLSYQERGSGKSAWFTHQNSKGLGTEKQGMGDKQQNEEKQ